MKMFYCIFHKHKVFHLYVSGVVFFSSPFWRNLLFHVSLIWGFLPVCVQRCICKTHFRKNLLLHILQTWGSSVVCIRQCILKLYFSKNSLLHTLQTWGFYKYVSMYGSLVHLSWIILCCMFHKHETVPLHVPRDDYSESSVY